MNVLMMYVPYAIVKKMMDKIIYLPILLVFLLGWYLAVTPSLSERYWKSIGPSWDAFLNPVNQEELTK